MERLTFNDLNKVAYDPWELCGMDKHCTKCCHEDGGCAKGCHILKMYRKLAEYEDSEEQGTLIRLPCVVGDTIYKLWYTECHLGETYPDSYSCSGCEDECDMKREISEFVVPSVQWIVHNIDNLNKTVYFLTREQAEQALNEMENK